MNEKEFLKARGAGLINVVDNLRDGWRCLAGGAVIGLSAAGIAIGVIPAKYEAAVLLQVGQVGQVGFVGHAGQGWSGELAVPAGQAVQAVQAGHVGSQPVESVTYAVERMKSPMFHLRVAESIGDEEWIGRIKSSGARGVKDFSPKIIKTASIIDLSVVAESKEKAGVIADAVIAELAKTHAELAKPELSKLRSDLLVAKEKLAGAEKEREAIDKVITAAGIKDERFTQLAMMISLRSQKETEIYSQRQLVTALEIALAEPATQPARAIEPVFVSERPVSPRTGMTMALGLMGGLLAGAMLFLVRAAWRRERNGQVA